MRAGVPCCIVIRVPEGSPSPWNRHSMPARVTVIREIHRNYIGIRVLIRLRHVDGVREAAVSGSH